MTPQEKAKELVDKFKNQFRWVELDYPVDLYIDTKQCALIAVDEILMCDAIFHANNKETIDEKKYWKQVKQSITKL